jgi:tRNA pseudouridine38-40 synthase
MGYRYFIQLSYNGAAYGGWQIQPNAATVQDLLESGLTKIAGLKDHVTGCGRTDAGVHASTFYAHFDSDTSLSEDALDNIVLKLNRFLPQDIAIAGIRPVMPAAHARFSAEWREYEYVIIRKKDPFKYNQAYFIHGNLDIEMMNRCASLLLGRHDFKSFSKVHTQVNNYFCDIHFARWQQEAHLLKFTIRADRFLRNMVRAIVGTLLDAGRGKLTTDEFQQIIDSKNRSAAGYSVPAKGLTLTGIGYPPDTFSDKPVFFSPEGCNKIISHYYSDSELHEGSGNEPNE